MDIYKKSDMDPRIDKRWKTYMYRVYDGYVRTKTGAMIPLNDYFSADPYVVNVYRDSSLVEVQNDINIQELMQKK